MSDTTTPDTAQPAVEVRFRGGGFAPSARRGVGVAVFVVLILLVEWGTRAGWISALTLPKPSDVAATFVELWQSGLLFKHLGPSLSRLAVGATLGISLAIAIILLVAAEMLGAEYGIGAYILEAGSLYDLERLFAGVLILSVLGVALSMVIGLIEKRLLAWRG